MHRELLAPAGSYESLIAAINAGADAVYAGGDKFGARAFADNFSKEELKNAIDFVHLHGKKLYLTINTLFKNNEVWEELYDFLYDLYLHGLDAVIVQDFGVISRISKDFKDLPIHASTQMTITGEQGINLLEESGVSRVVLSRELNLEEIILLRSKTNLEIEAFIHGALCYCYSGKCLLSSMIGGRSGNRGRCAQPCRMPYNLVEGDKRLNRESDKYLISPKDLCTLDIIPELIESGINSFKIEGRMKKPEYVAGVVSIYRKYIDAYIKLGKEDYESFITKNKKSFEDDYRILMDLYNRGGFTKGYYNRHNGKDMISVHRPNHFGVPVGVVESINDKRIGIRLKHNIYDKDILEVRGNNDFLYEFTIKDKADKNSIIYINTNSKYITTGQEVHRTKNESLLNDLREKYIHLNKKVKIKGIFVMNVNENITLTITYKDITVCVEGDIAQKAVSSPLTKEALRSRLNKTGNTPFEFSKLDIITNEDAFVTNKAINELRRNALQELEISITKEYGRIKPIYTNEYIEQVNKNLNKGNAPYGLTVYLKNEKYINTAMEFNEVNNIYLDMDTVKPESMAYYSNICHKNNKKVYFVLPHIFRSKTYNYYKDNINSLISSEADGYVIRNIEEYVFLKDILKVKIDFEIICDFMVYIMNDEAKKYWNAKGINHFTAPVELNEKELKECNLSQSDLIVYGHMPLMVSAGCLVKNSKGCTNTRENIYLQDRYNKKFYVENVCCHCYNIIYNGYPTVLLSNKKEVEALKPLNIRLDFTIEDKNKTAEIINAFVDEYIHSKKTQYLIKDFTRGHFKREVVK